MVKKIRAISMIAPLVFASMGFGEEGGVELTPSGFGSFEIGQVVQANPLTTKDADFYQSEHLLFQKIFIGFNLQASYEPLPMTTNLGAGNANFKVNHCNVIEVPKMLVKWMFYNDSASSVCILKISSLEGMNFLRDR